MSSLCGTHGCHPEEREGFNRRRPMNIGSVITAGYMPMPKQTVGPKSDIRIVYRRRWRVEEAGNAFDLDEVLNEMATDGYNIYRVYCQPIDKHVKWTVVGFKHIFIKRRAL